MSKVVGTAHSIPVRKSNKSSSVILSFPFVANSGHIDAIGVATEIKVKYDRYESKCDRDESKGRQHSELTLIEGC